MQHNIQNDHQKCSRSSICSSITFNKKISIDIENVNNKNLTQMSFQDILSIIKVIFGTTCSVCIGLLLQMLILSINLHFVGKLRDPIYLDAIGFSVLIINCTGGFFIIGLNQGCGTYIGRAHGKNDINMVNNYFFKGLSALITVFLIFIFIIFNCSKILLVLGQKKELSMETQKYATSILPGIFANYCFDLIRNYLNGQEIYKAPMIILGVSIPLHYLFCYILFENLGVKATIYSTNFTYFLILLSSFVYLYYTKKIPQLIKKNELILNFKEYLKQCSLIALPVFIDTLGFEINSVLIGLLGDLKQFGAHVAVSNYTAILFSIPVGMGGAFMLLTSNSVGKNCDQSIKNLIKLSQILSLIVGIIFATFQITTRKIISQFYTQDITIQNYFQQLTFIYSLLITLDFYSQANLGILKALGKAKDSLYAFILSYYIIGLPISAYLGLCTNLQIFGFWYGFCISIVFITLITIIILYKINITQQLYRVHTKLVQEQNLLQNQDKELIQIYK